jgi:Uma2 family endonuclease
MREETAMETTLTKPANGTTLPEPVWEIATLFPDQGQWSEEEYLGLGTNRLVEFSDGTLEVLPMPTQTHQTIVFLLSRLLYAFASTKAVGYVLPAALRVRLWEGKYREPDVVFMLSEHASRRHESYW